MTTHPCTGTCSRSVSFEIDGDGTLSACSFDGGCPGNTAGVAKLVTGRPAAEVAALLKGTPCGRRGTSCPDQLARAIEAELAARGRKSGFSLVIPIALVLALAVFGFVVYRYQLLHHLPVISELPVKPDIPVLSSFSEAEPCVFPVAADRPELAPAPPGFADVRWQASPGDVRAAEGVPPFRTSPTAVVYSLDILNQPCLLTYFFRRERLYGVQFQFAAPGSAFLPALAVPQAQKLYGRLKEQLDGRYGQTAETVSTHPRPETEDCTLRLREARRRLAERGAESGGAAEEDRRAVTALEEELKAAQVADAADPIVTRRMSQWRSGPMEITLVADMATTPPGLEIRYKTNPSR